MRMGDPSTEMSNRLAHMLSKELRAAYPWLDVEVWAIAQGLSYIRVDGPTTRGIVALVLHTSEEVANFRGQLDAAPPSSQDLRDWRAAQPYRHRHRP